MDLLLLFGESGFHVCVSLSGNRRLTFGATSTGSPALVHVGVEPWGLGVTFVHFFVGLPL